MIRFYGWIFYWAKLVEGVIGILTFAFYCPILSMPVAIKIAKLRLAAANLNGEKK